jgi:hypothetical protein
MNYWHSHCSYDVYDNKRKNKMLSNIILTAILSFTPVKDTSFTTDSVHTTSTAAPLILAGKKGRIRISDTDLESQETGKKGRIRILDTDLESQEAGKKGRIRIAINNSVESMY